MIYAMARYFDTCKKFSASLLSLILLGPLSSHTVALDTQVLSNFNQPSLGYYFRLGVSHLIDIPFTTDTNFIELDGAELPVQTWYGSGGLQVSIWSVNGLFQPDSQIAVLSGPTNPTGFASYTGAKSLSANTSYFLVLSVANGGSPIIVPSINGSGADSTPASIWSFGTDTDGNNSADRINRCSGSRDNDYVTISWRCDYPASVTYFPKVRLLAEVAAPPTPTYSLTSTPTSIVFSTTAVGSTSPATTATITNDGTADQDLGTLSVPAGSRFSISATNCSNTTLSANGGTCTVDLRFSPDHGGRTMGTLLIPGDSSDNRSPYSLPLVGHSNGPTIQLSALTSEVISKTNAVPTLPSFFLFALIVMLGLMVLFKLRGQQKRNSA